MTLQANNGEVAFDNLVPTKVGSFTLKVTSTGLSNGGNANYIAYAGSSQAAPFVTAAAVLVKQTLVQAGNASLATSANILNILKTTGVSLVDNKPAAAAE